MSIYSDLVVSAVLEKHGKHHRALTERLHRLQKQLMFVATNNSTNCCSYSGDNAGRAPGDAEATGWRRKIEFLISIFLIFSINVCSLHGFF